MIKNENLEQGEEESGIRFPTIEEMCFSFVLVITNKDQQMLDYLLNDLSTEVTHLSMPFWNSDSLIYVLKGCVSESWLEGLTLTLLGPTAKHIFLSMDYF